MTYSGYMETISISNLKSHLSAVLERVRKGTKFKVINRNSPIAFLSSIRDHEQLEIVQDSIGKFMQPKSLSLEVVDPVHFLLEDRERR